VLTEIHVSLTDAVIEDVMDTEAFVANDLRVKQDLGSKDALGSQSDFNSIGKHIVLRLS